MHFYKSFGLLFSLLFVVVCGEYASFQQGVNSYAGCKSAAISDDSLASSGYGVNGVTYRDGNNDWCIGHLHSTLGYDIAVLLKFENLKSKIPQGSTILSANLTLYLTVWESGAKLVGKYLKPYWYGDGIDADGGNAYAEVGWRYRNTSAYSWSSLGATGDGTDLISSKSFVFPSSGSTIPADGTKPYTSSLDTSVVQSWLDDSSTNNGVMLQADVNAIHIGIVQCQRSTSGRDVSYRPLLMVEYTTGTSGTVSGSSSSSASASTTGTQTSVTGNQVSTTGNQASTTGNQVGTTGSVSNSGASTTASQGSGSPSTTGKVSGSTTGNVSGSVSTTQGGSSTTQNTQGSTTAYSTTSEPSQRNTTSSGKDESNMASALHVQVLFLVLAVVYCLF